MNTGAFVKGMLAGAVIGMGVTMVANPMDERDKRRLAKRTNRVFTTIGSIADNVLDVMK